MSVLPAPGYLSDSGRTHGEQKAALEDLRNVISELPGGTAETELTISSGSVAPTGSSHRIDTEADAGSDELTHLDQSNHPDGRVVTIRAENASRVVTVVHGAGGNGQILLHNSQDVILDDTNKRLLLQRSGTSWLMIALLPFEPVIDRVSANVAVANTVAETTVYTKSIKANSLGTNRRLRLTMNGQIGSDGSDRQITFRLKYGATTIATAIVIIFQNTSAAGVQVEGHVSGDGGTGNQHGFLLVNIGGAASAAGGEVRLGRGVATEDSTADKDLVVTAEWAAAGIAITYTMESAILEIL